jgi:hypothetical protein
MRKIKESLSIVTACYNEQASIEITIKKRLNYFKTNAILISHIILIN